MKGPLCFPAEARRGFTRPPRRGISPRSLRHAMGSVRGPAPPWSRPEDRSWSGGCCDSELVRAVACASPAPSSRGSGSASVAPVLAGGRARHAPLPSIPWTTPALGEGSPAPHLPPAPCPLLPAFTRLFPALGKGKKGSAGLIGAAVLPAPPGGRWGGAAGLGTGRMGRRKPKPSSLLALLSPSSSRTPWPAPLPQGWRSDRRDLIL